MQRIFKIEEVLKELDFKMDDFVKARKNVYDYHREVRRKHMALELPKPHEIASIIK